MQKIKILTIAGSLTALSLVGMSFLGNNSAEAQRSIPTCQDDGKRCVKPVETNTCVCESEIEAIQ